VVDSVPRATPCRPSPTSSAAWRRPLGNFCRAREVRAGGRVNNRRRAPESRHL